MPRGIPTPLQRRPAPAALSWGRAQLHLRPGAAAPRCGQSPLRPRPVAAAPPCGRTPLRPRTTAVLGKWLIAVQQEMKGHPPPQAVRGIRIFRIQFRNRRDIVPETVLLSLLGTMRSALGTAKNAVFGVHQKVREQFANTFANKVFAKGVRGNG